MVLEVMGIQLIEPQAVLIVIGVAISISLFSTFLHRKLVDKEKMNEIRKRIESHQKEHLAAQKANDQKKLKQLEREQAEVMNLLKKNFMMSMKPMLITMPVFLVVLYFMRTYFDPLGPILELPFNLPFLSYSLPENNIVNGMDWFGIYLISAIGTSLTMELILKKVFHK